MNEWLQIPWLPLGTFFNVICILIGGVVGLRLSRQIPEETQRRIRRYLAGLTVIAGGYMMAQGLYGGWKGSESFWIFLLLGLIALLSISLRQPVWNMAKTAGSVGWFGRGSQAAL